MQGVENVYTQHTPLLTQTLESLVKGRLRDTDYATVGAAAAAPGVTRPPKFVVVFIVGGTTYEEARAVAELNAQGEKHEGWPAGVKFLLGGSSVQNSRTFMKDLTDVALNQALHGAPE